MTTLPLDILARTSATRSEYINVKNETKNKRMNKQNVIKSFGMQFFSKKKPNERASITTLQVKDLIENDFSDYKGKKISVSCFYENSGWISGKIFKVGEHIDIPLSAYFEDDNDDNGDIIALQFYLYPDDITI